MSWETLINGHISFKSGVPESFKYRIIVELEEVFEAELVWDGRWGEYKVEDVNWTSHVEEEKIEEVYRKWKPFFKQFSVSLYYLSEADYDKCAEDEDQDTAGLLESLFNELTEALGSGECEKANNTLEALVELLKTANVNGKAIAEKINILVEALEAALEAKVDAEVTETFGVDKDHLMELARVLEELKVPTARLKKVLLCEAL